MPRLYSHPAEATPGRLRGDPLRQAQGKLRSAGGGTAAPRHSERSEESQDVDPSHPSLKSPGAQDDTRRAELRSEEADASTQYW